MKGKLFATTILLISFLTIACEKENPVIPDEEELITTLRYTLTPMSGEGETVVLSFQDLDGDGGADPIISTDTLAANETYIGMVELLNESETPVENITEEVAEEAEDHQFFFQSSIENLVIAYDDEDAAENPIGLRSRLTTEAAAMGTITIILRHKPNKTASGVPEGDILNAGGESDIEVTFSVNVQ